MPPIQSKLGAKTLHSQTREVVNNIHSFMKSEAASGDFLIPVKKVQERVSAATKVPERTIRKIIKEGKQCEEEGTSFGTPGKVHRVPKRITDVDDFDKRVIRQTIYNFYINDKTVPTVSKLLPKLKDAINFNGGSTSLKIILRDMGFKWKKTRNNKAVLQERHDIREQRVSYLRAIKKYREEGRPLIYEDETYIHSTHTRPKNWSDDKTSGLLAPISKGPRLIIVHAGGRAGFVPGAFLMFKSNRKTGDYHHEMNADNYQKWITEKLIPNLPPRSVFIIDNAPYHNVQLHKAPSSNSKKSDMQDWLRRNNVQFQENMLKVELYGLIKAHKPLHKTYVIDNLLAMNGHCVLRLPPYSPELNPLELIWADIKQWVAGQNTTFKLEEVMKLCQQRVDDISVEKWERVCEHVEKIEDEYIEQEGIMENVIESFIITGGDSSSESDDDEGDDHNENHDDNGSDISGIESLSDE